MIEVNPCLKNCTMVRKNLHPSIFLHALFLNSLGKKVLGYSFGWNRLLFSWCSTVHDYELFQDKIENCEVIVNDLQFRNTKNFSILFARIPCTS